MFHIYVYKHLQTSQPSAENAVNEVPSSAPRFRLDMLKNKAKRSLTESFESILSRVSILVFIASDHNFVALFTQIVGTPHLLSFQVAAKWLLKIECKKYMRK